MFLVLNKSLCIILLALSRFTQSYKVIPKKLLSCFLQTLQSRVTIMILVYMCVYMSACCAPKMVILHPQYT